MFKLLIFLLISIITAKEKILILHDGSKVEIAFSKFFNNLKQNFNLEFKTAEDSKLQLIEYGVLKYQHLILMAPNTDEFGGDLSPSKISEYVDNGGNLLIMADSRITDTIRLTISEFGMETDTEETFVIDHFNYSPEYDQGDHTTLELPVDQYYHESIPFNPKSANRKSSTLLYQGIGMTLSKSNSLISSILSGPSTCYSWTPSAPVTSMPMMVGSEVSLISAMEAKNNARVLVVGSLKFFSDEFSEINGDYTAQLALWTFQRAGVLKIENMKHYLSENGESLETYTIYDKITYSVDIYEKDQNLKWIPAKISDFQIEFTRLDPFVRQFLKSDENSATHKLEFVLPDTYGVFKFIIDHKRIGYTYLQDQMLVPVRPLQHTQYERFIVTAYPYYAGAGSMLIGLFLFSFVFLYHK